MDKARLEDMEVKVKELEHLVITCICVVCQTEPLHCNWPRKFLIISIAMNVICSICLNISC